MVKLFHHYPKGKPIIRNAYLDKTLYLLSNELENVKNYYRESNFTIKRPNMLISLINQLDIDLLDTPENVYATLDNTALYVTRGYNISSEGHNGKYVIGTVVPNATEVFLFKESSYDSVNALNYKEAVSIRNIYNTYDGIPLHHPNKFKYMDSDIDLFVYIIDPVMLGMQYYYWANNEMMLDNDIDIARFLYTIPYVSLMDSILNISLINRFFSLHLGNKPETFINYNTFSVYDLESKIDKGYKDLDKDIVNKSLRFNDLLTIIPVVGGDALDALDIDVPYYTTNTEWIMWLSRIYYIYILVTKFNKKNLSMNRDLVTDLKIDIRLAERNKSFSYLQKDSYFSLIYTLLVDDYLKELKKIKG